MMNDIIRTVDRGEFCALVLLDLSAAFDTIDHGILFDVLEKRFGLSHDALKWMTSYFEGRTQTFRAGKEDSDPRTLKLEFLKDRLLDLKLSSVTRRTYRKLWRPSRSNTIYMQTTASFLTRQPSRIRMPVASGSRAASNQFANGAQAADFNWIFDKTELIWFGTRSMLSKLQGLETSIQVGGVEVKPVETVRDLGVTLDCQLNMRAHISKIVSACYYHLRRIRQLRHCLDKDDRQRLVSALVLSRIDYCNVALVGLPASSLAPLQRVINAAARFVANLRPRDHVSHVLRELHWLPNPWANIIQGVSHDVQHRQWNSADIHDWHGHAHFRSSRSVSSPLCRRGIVDVPRTRTVFGSRAFQSLGLERSACPRSSHSGRYPIQISTQNSFFSNSIPDLILINYAIIFMDYLCLMYIFNSN